MLRTTIELSIEDLELIIDLLGPPSEVEHHRVKTLRRRLQETVMSMRQGKSVPDGLV
ncbi:MAG: hypothetical protein M3P33_01785 [bacterium]|nr:hypothetical protein [bacterium]